MKAKFKQAVKIDGHHFPLKDGKPTVHVVSKKVAKHPHFQKFVDAGLIEKAGADEVAQPRQETPHQRAERLKEKLQPDAKKPAKPQNKAEDAPADDSDFSFDDLAAEAEATGDVEAHDTSEDEDAGKGDSSGKKKKKHR